MKTKKKQAQPTNVIVRHKARGYVSVPSAIFYDKKVSIKDRGLYATIMALPDDWNFTVTGLIEILPDGEDAIRAALRRLQQQGWVSYRRLFDAKGRITGTQWEIFDQKLSYIKDDAEADDDEQESPHTENPDMDNPRGENPAQFKQSLNLNLSLNTHTHTADGSPSVEEDKKHSDEEQRVIDSVQGFIHDKCADLELRFEPLTDEQVLYLHNKLDIGIPDLAKYLKDIQAKQLNYMVGASLCRLIEKFREYDFTRRKKK